MARGSMGGGPGRQLSKAGAMASRGALRVASSRRTRPSAPSPARAWALRAPGRWRRGLGGASWAEAAAAGRARILGCLTWFFWPLPPRSLALVKGWGSLAGGWWLEEARARGNQAVGAPGGLWARPRLVSTLGGPDPPSELSSAARQGGRPAEARRSPELSGHTVQRPGAAAKRLSLPSGVG